MGNLLPVLATVLTLASAPPPRDILADALRKLADEKRLVEAAGTIVTQAEQATRKGLREAGERESKTWYALKTKTDWEKYRDARLKALKASLSAWPTPPKDLKVKVRKTIKGKGYAIDCLTFESRPGLVVTANLYRSTTTAKAMPGIIICHSHHNPKTQGELQDMGVLWARAGCMVLVLDQLGHGERRQHQFRTKDDYPTRYLISRQDYYHRYHTAVQLQTIGESLIGWMAWDMMRGVDLLLKQPGIDKKKIVLLGSVAGGGDPVAVAGALDERISVVGPFNFGGPQPETKYPLPKNAETSFLYTGSGYWESTRNLAFSAKDGFLPWVIVGAIAPRKHIYGHEFGWDKERDPVWKRLQKIHGWYGSGDTLASASGTGVLSGRPPQASHCNNIGEVHRKGIHAALKAWFDLDAKEVRDRREASELLCLTKNEKLKPLYQVADALASERIAVARKSLTRVKPKERRTELQQRWTAALGPVAPPKDVIATGFALPNLPLQISAYYEAQLDATDHRLGGMLTLTPGRKLKSVRWVLCVAQGGVRGFLRYRASEIARLLRTGHLVALIDSSEAATVLPGGGRGRSSRSTSLAASGFMLGRTTIGQSVRQLRLIIATLKQENPKATISIWADNFAEVNKAGERLEVPLELKQPHQAEPLGGIVALLCALYEDGITSIRIRGGLVGYRSLLGGRFAHVPYDIVVPGVLTTGDLADVVAALAPLPIRLEGLVDGLNRRVSVKDTEREYKVARDAYNKAKEKLVIVSRE